MKIQLRPPKGHSPLQFSTDVCCGQTAGGIKRPLGTEVGLGPGYSVLDGDPASPIRGGTAAPPLFGPCLLWPNGWMDQDTTWYGDRPRPRRRCVTWRPSSPYYLQQPQHFSDHVALVRSPISAAAEHLYFLFVSCLGYTKMNYLSDGHKYHICSEFLDHECL